LDFDHPYDLSRRFHPEITEEMRQEARKADERERGYTPPPEKRDPGPTARESILKAMRQVAERG
jgi:hypothetical protein